VLGEMRFDVDQLSQQWVGQRVWVAGNPFSGLAKVEKIGQDEWVVLRFENAPAYYPSCVAMHVAALGRVITLVE